MWHAPLRSAILFSDDTACSRKNAIAPNKQLLSSGIVFRTRLPWSPPGMSGTWATESWGDVVVLFLPAGVLSIVGILTAAGALPAMGVLATVGVLPIADVPPAAFFSTMTLSPARRPTLAS